MKEDIFKREKAILLWRKQKKTRVPPSPPKKRCLKVLNGREGLFRIRFADSVHQTLHRTMDRVGNGEHVLQYGVKPLRSKLQIQRKAAKFGNGHKRVFVFCEK